jgi:hypothetical protein
VAGLKCPECGSTDINHPEEWSFGGAQCSECGYTGLDEDFDEADDDQDGGP